MARRDLNNGQSNLAIALLASGDLAEAARIMAPVLAFDEELVGADPRNSQAQRDVSWDLGMLGQIAFDGGRLEEALGYGRPRSVRTPLAILRGRRSASPTAIPGCRWKRCAMT